MYIHVLTRAYTYTNIFVYMYVYTSIYIYGVGLTRALASTTGVRTPRSWTWSRVNPMLGGWVNPHREQQTIPQGQTSSPRKSLFTPTAKARPDQAALVTSVEARGDTHRARPRSPSRIYTYRCLYICRNGRVPWQAPRKCARHAPGHGSGLTFIYIHIYIYMYICIHMSEPEHIYTDVFLCICMYIHLYTSIYNSYIYICIYIYVYLFRVHPVVAP